MIINTKHDFKQSYFFKSLFVLINKKLSKTLKKKNK